MMCYQVRSKGIYTGPSGIAAIREEQHGGNRNRGEGGPGGSFIAMGNVTQAELQTT